MRNTRLAVVSLAISSAVFLSAALTFVSSYFGIRETHPLALIISPLVFATYMFEMPLAGVSRSLGFPIVLPALGLIFAFLSYRKKERANALVLASVALIAVSTLMYLSLAALTYRPGAMEQLTTPLESTR